ncbi:MAG: hypothetical protein FJ213_09395 [Ignavibacteria bacterium]|nr:hypothetical protein [Ignavibacteria bacterium]
MFDREKQIVINKFCDVIFKDHNEITLGKIISLAIPESIIKYFDEDIKQRLDRELAEIKNFSTFNFEKPEVQPLLAELTVILKTTKSFSMNDFSTSLKSALDFTIDYLLRPCDTLTDFVFDYKEIQSREFILQRLNFVKDYEYLPEIIKGYLKRKKIDSIGKKEFLALCKNADKEFTKDFTIIDHYVTFKSFKNYLNRLDLYLTSHAEAEAFQIFLMDKEQESFASFIEEKKKDLTDPRLDFKAFLQSVTLQRSDTSRKSDALEFLNEEKSKPAKEIFRAETIQDLGQDLEAPVEKVLETNSEEPYEVKQEPLEQSSVEKKAADVFMNSSYSLQNNELFRKLTGEDESKKTNYARNLDGLIKNRLRKLVVKKLFNGTEEEYFSTIALLDKAENWDEASQFLTDLFQRKNIQPYSKAAIKFTEFLYDNIR